MHVYVFLRIGKIYEHIYRYVLLSYFTGLFTCMHVFSSQQNFPQNSLHYNLQGIVLKCRFEYHGYETRRLTSLAQDGHRGDRCRACFSA